jgi:hypothetical protein
MVDISTKEVPKHRRNSKTQKMKKRLAKPLNVFCLIQTTTQPPTQLLGKMPPPTYTY